ncbi:MAG: hypothetical protein RIS04_1630 [Pseudomonadota bacterium]|jgi:uncharacterized protein YjeT (DUF2065 family)|uniref:DUF2065 domain-containing protein n=1 Tax=Limnohabitans sp. TaxID=1907725 RepID=UPI00311F154F
MPEASSWMTALALVLVIEGLLPMIAPGRWREMFRQILLMQDGQIRFFGLISVLLGLIGLWWLD